MANASYSSLLHHLQKLTIEPALISSYCCVRGTTASVRASIYSAGQGGLDVASLARRSHADALTGEAGGGVTISMAEYSNDRRKVRHDLEIARTKLFEQFLKHPQDARLVLAVKLIDGQIASCSEWIRTKERGAEKEYQKLLH